MSKTYFSTNDEETKKVWDEKLFRDTVKGAYFNKFMGEGQESAVQVKTQLAKQKGDTVKFGLRFRLQGSGVNAGQTLEGNEEKLNTSMETVTLGQLRHAVRTEGKLSEQRAFFSIPNESRQAILDWGSEAIDELCIVELTRSPTKIVYGGSASSTANITASDKITPALIRKVKAGALTGWGRTQVPLKPVKTQFGKYLILLCHQDVIFDLKENAAFEQARREAMERSSQHPIFTGSIAIYDGVVIHEHENVPIVSNWGAGANIPGCKCVLFGAQALCWAWGQRPRTIQRDFDYDNEIGYAWDVIAGIIRPDFTFPADYTPNPSGNFVYGSIGVYVARTEIATSNAYLDVKLS